jgi:hypothetical protein
MCCFKNLKNFEKLNNMVQVICSVAIRVIQTMPEEFDKEQQKEKEIKSEKSKENSPELKEGELTVQGMCMSCAEPFFSSSKANCFEFT